MTTQRMQEQLVVEELASRIARYLEGEKGAVEESALVGKFRGFGRIRTLALRWLAERGHVRRTRNAGGTTVIAYTVTPEPVVWATAGLHEVREAALEAERREALKPTAEEYGTDTESYRFYAERLAAGTMTAEDLPFKVAAQRDECPKVKRQRRWQGGATRTFAPRAQNADPIPASARREMAEQLRSGDAAWNTAKAQHVANLPTLSHKILHLLARDGARTEASFVALAEGEERPVPEKAVRQAVHELGQAGKIRKGRSRKTGRVFLAPLERMTERELETLLIGVMADPKSGIPVPEGSKLARRVEGFRKAQAERRAEREAARWADAEQAAEQPVEA